MQLNATPVYNNNAKKQFQHSLVTVFFLFSTVLVALAAAQDQMSMLTGDIKNCPPLYLSPDAESYFQRTGQVLVSGSKEDALRGYRAAIKLGDMGGTAIGAVSTLIEQFPKAIHVSEIRSANYAGEGTFDDWLSTYAMNEKNKFMLTSPFLDYNNISLCESYIDAVPQVTFIQRQPQNGPVIKKATVDIAITFTVYFGTCALSRITGMTLGNVQNDWRIWWAQNGSSGFETGFSASSSESPKIIANDQSFADIIVKGKYRMSLKTGDEFVGIVESKDDTSLILETVEGKPFVFSRKLIERSDLIDLPKSLQKKVVVQPGKNEPTVEYTPVTLDELIYSPEKNLTIEVKITSGSTFTGLLSSVDTSGLKIKIEGSLIPIAKEVIHSMTLVKKIVPVTIAAPSGPDDTIIVKSNIVDDWGKPKPDIICIGKVVSENNLGIALRRKDGTTQQIKQADIVRVIKHTESSAEDQIKRYALSLNCPAGMVLVDLPPGMQKRPFFKTCIDKFEYPNKEGSLPQGNLSYSNALQLCEQQGKRLCTAQEWQWACSGLDGFPYPYGKTLEENRCNAASTSMLETSGSRINCFSKFGAFDMTGNIFEWVTASGNQGAMMGGPYSKCQTVTPGTGGDAKPLSGLRCCKSN